MATSDALRPGGREADDVHDGSDRRDAGSGHRGGDGPEDEDQATAEHDDATEEAQSEEDVVEAAFRQATHEGIQRLNRSWPSLLSTGFVGGLDLGLGVLSMVLVRHVTGSELLGALAFTFGFIALILARSELFTENFLVPIAAIVSESGTMTQVARLWIFTAMTNLIGGWVIMGVIVIAAPELGRSATLQELGGHFVELGLGLTTFVSAVLAGSIMTLMTWMERGNRSLVGKLTAAVGAGFLLAGTPALHSIVTSLEMFGALQAGAPFGYLDWLGLFGWAVLGNMVGGIGLVTLLRFLQVGLDTIEHERRLH